MSRVDDMWSLLFVIIDFTVGTLPWKALHAKLADNHIARRVCDVSLCF